MNKIENFATEHFYKEETYTVTFRFRNGGIKTITHCCKEQLGKMLNADFDCVIVYHKN